MRHPIRHINYKVGSFAGLRFNNSYTELPQSFYESILPNKSPNPSIVRINEALSEELGLNLVQMRSERAAEFFSGNYITWRSYPIACAYAGHQFGNFVSTLGDGRAHLLGEFLDKNGQRFDIQLKGSGQTSFSREGDGRATLGSVMREYIVSEGMHFLNIRTTRSLAITKTGEFVQRETATPGAVLTRIASSHIRVGTFEYCTARKDLDALKILCDYTIKRHYPDCAGGKNPYISLLKAVIDSYAKLVASWMGIGFIHGVMNTDNTLISCETIDYGPCAFMDEYNPNKVFSSIDKHGRYAYAKQPSIAKYNMEKFANSIITLLDENIFKAERIAEELVKEFDSIYQAHWLTVMRKKLGMFTADIGDGELINDFLKMMHEGKMDFTITFRQLSNFIGKEKIAMPTSRLEWLNKWLKRLQNEGKSTKQHVNLMDSSNPAFIPRNHLIEAAIKAATESNDFSKMNEMLSVLEKPYIYEPEHKKYAARPTKEEIVCKTFCGT